MQDMAMTPSTLVLLVLVAAWAVWAVRRIAHRGLCDCNDHCGDGTSSVCSACHGTSCSSGCACSVADKMVADIDKSLR